MRETPTGDTTATPDRTPAPPACPAPAPTRATDELTDRQLAAIAGGDPQVVADPEPLTTHYNKIKW